MFKILCDPKPTHPLHIHSTVNWLKAAPFYYNRRGVLYHRVKAASSHLEVDGTIHHESVGYWCGNGCCATNGFFTDLRQGPIDSIVVCERCEYMATRAGLPSTDTLALRHIHVGRAKAIRTCCNE